MWRKPAMSSVRCAVRKNTNNQYWSVYEAETCQPAYINEMPMERLDEFEALEVLKLINTDLIHPKKSA
jgi:hypothetical protein